MLQCMREAMCFPCRQPDFGRPRLAASSAVSTTKSSHVFVVDSLGTVEIDVRLEIVKDVTERDPKKIKYELTDTRHLSATFPGGPARGPPTDGTASLPQTGEAFWLIDADLMIIKGGKTDPPSRLERSFCSYG